ncbi:MAG: replication-associated recombination protein A [Alphaproteobacteria bacterium]|nr:replication-associated recombination protein A [Alphaproteobacteria bacterium]
MSSLLNAAVKRPLADVLRPKKLSEVAGQEHLLADDAPLGRMLNSGNISSFILWGPPGCGKTTIARLVAQYADMDFVTISAVFSGVSDLRKIFDAAKEKLEQGRQTILFVDEIHRFNRSQQDSFLPYVEDGTVILIGATTENPSFELNSALLSRCKVFVLKRLSDEALERIIEKAEEYTKKPLPVEDETRDLVKSMADGDGRYLSNMIEVLFNLPDAEIAKGLIDNERLMKIIAKRPAIYDKDRDGHYNLISAVHKSLRGSDVDAALYWTARMVASGEDVRYILRRLTRFAVEDVGMSDPNALTQAISAWKAYERLGSPEGDLALAQLVVYLATAPKSIGVYKAWNEAFALAKQTGSLMPPMHILNAPTKLMEDLGYNAGYQYDPETKDGFSGQNYFPEKMGRRKFYKPIERGFEREIVKRLAYWEKLRREKNANKDDSNT